MRGIRGRMDKPKERVGTGYETHTCYQTLSCFSAKSKANQGQEVRESRRAPSVGSHHARQSFRENLPATLLVGAEEAAHMQFQVNRTTHPGEICDRSHIARVNPSRTVMTEWAFRLCRSACHHGGNRRLGGVKELHM